MDETEFGGSSPDPLGNSSSNLQYSTPTKGKSKQYTPKKPLADTNGNVRLQDFYLNTPPAFLSGTSSPTKTTAEAENLISPWRIRVTVEAEREDEKENSHVSPAKKLTQRTTTTIVPLKGAHDSSPAPVKRGRGRPRKSLDSPVKRTGTPKPNKKGRRKTQDGSEIENCERDASVGLTPPRRGRGRPRKSVDSNVNDLWLAYEDQTTASTCINETIARETTIRRKSRGRRKAMTPVKSTADQGSSSQVEQVNEADHSASIQREMTFSRQNKTQQDHQRHSPTPASTPIYQETEETVSNSIGNNDQRQNTNTNVDTIDEDLVYDGGSRNSNVRSDPTDEHKEFDSILESEGFSMVSISSIPSAQQHLSSPAEPDRVVQSEASESRSSSMHANQSGHLTTNVLSEGHSSSSQHLSNPSLQRISGPEQSTVLSYLPSSPPVFNPQYQSKPLLQRQTPSVILSSPSLPPHKPSVPLQQSPRALDKRTDGTPKLVRVVKAGIALQGVLSPPKAFGSSGSPFQQRLGFSSSTKSPKERLDDLFSGFGVGTRRELRAGLRLGEELAKKQAGQRISWRQEPAEMANSFPPAAEDMDVFLEDVSLAYPRLPTPDDKEEYTLSLPDQQQIVYPTIPMEQLPSPARSAVEDLDDRMSWTADTPVKPVLSPPKPTEDAVSPEMSCVFRDDTMMLDWKAEWQREREAVSKQIQSASESQVIVIHSDDSDVDADAGTDAEQSTPTDEEESEEDIWQAEAHSSDPARETTPEIPEVLFQEEVIKPRRSKLPSPWRRNSQVVYSDEVLQEEPDLFWQPNQQMASNRARQRQEPSNVSVLSEYVIREQHHHLSPTEVSPTEVTPTQSPITDQDLSIDEAEEKIPVDDIEEEETVLEASHISDAESHTSLLSQTPEDTLTEDPGNTLTSTSPSPPAFSLPTNPPLPPAPAKSWFSRLTAYLLPTPSPKPNPYPLPPNLPRLAHPLPLTYPWTQAHWLALNALYKDSRLHPEYYPFRPHGPAAWLLDMEVFSKGWVRGVDELWCGIVEVFLEAYLEGGASRGRGVGLGTKGGEEREIGDGKAARKSQSGLIGEREVLMRIFGLWVHDVRRGLVNWDGPRGE